MYEKVYHNLHKQTRNLLLIFIGPFFKYFPGYIIPDFIISFKLL
ncbi:hypothetical protein QKC54_gp0060 [Megavirus baoshan]|uniref:Uncharacterized protein n=1 Tax=Megavirus baoshan TaxID=2496520 RepID=A0A8K1T146_9VIRU|nr:hypothetical protein QKC54_gp0060 [Megavirus baoshan]UFX99915.1 hypothetical protein Mb1012 [Megavirus baoshan]